MEFKCAYACNGRISCISSTKSKTTLFSNKNKSFLLIESELRSICDNFKCYSLNVIHASSQVSMDAGLYFHHCFFAFFSDLYFYFKYYFYPSNESSSAHCTFINPTVVQVLRNCDN